MKHLVNFCFGVLIIAAVLWLTYTLLKVVDKNHRIDEARWTGIHEQCSRDHKGRMLMDLPKNMRIQWRGSGMMWCVKFLTPQGTRLDLLYSIFYDERNGGSYHLIKPGQSFGQAEEMTFEMPNNDDDTISRP